MNSVVRQAHDAGARLEAELRAGFSEWMRVRNYSPRTIPDYDRYVRNLLRWLSRAASVSSISDVSPALLRQYQLFLCRPAPPCEGAPPRLLSVSSQICHLAAVRTFFSWL